MSNLLSQIEQGYPKFSKSHKRIADFILHNYEKAAYCTAARLGAETGISESTVVRFATHLGFEGYPEFQEDLRETIKGKLTSTQRMEVSGTQIREDALLYSVLQKDREMIKS
ncbi:MAG: MurR/RpiR family transcriptional regulator, partial [Clostridia bacterium]|nr:MurR/RpiR family transcriptional regulator [Clostridia bacterium]